MTRKFHAVAAASLLLGCLVLAGCDAVDRLRAVDVRVNKAVPPDIEVEVARQRLAAETGDDSTRREQTEHGFAEQLRLRGLTCLRPGPDIGFGTSPAEIAQTKVDRVCLRGRDQLLLRWIGLQRVRLALAKPPLRPVPAAAPRYIATSHPISWVDFADRAGIALVSLQTHPREMAVIDIADGKELWRAPWDNPLKALALSPNGRVFIAPEARGGVRVRSAETGETYALLHGLTGLHWLGADAALVHQLPAGVVPGGPRMLDLATGRTQDVPGLDARVVEVLSAGDDAGRRFLALGRNVQLLELGQADGAPALRVVSEGQQQVRDARVAFGAVAHGQYLDALGGQVNLVSLADLKTHTVALAPAHVQRALPTAQADELLLTVQMPGATPSQADLVWSRSHNTVAAVQTPPAPGREIRHVWIAPLRRLGLLSDNKIQVLDSLTLSPAQPLEQWLSARQDEDNARKLEAAKADAARLEAAPAADSPYRPAASQYPGFRLSRGPLLESLRVDTLTDTAAFTRQARDARIEGVGIQRLAAAAPAGSKRLAEVVELKVRGASRPLILVLSSQDAVRWALNVDPSARIQAVLLSGPARSVVLGPPGTAVYQLGATAAFDGDGPAFLQLQQDVKRVSGRMVQTFQHRREGLAFSVGE